MTALRRGGLAAAVVVLGVLGPLLSGPAWGQPAQSPRPARGVEQIPAIPYREVDGQELLLDAYLPETGDDHPAVVVLHGGGFDEGDRSRMRGLCVRLARADFACFAIEYRLAPDYVYPAPVEDAKASIEFIREHADEYRVDPLRVATFGTSAGGTISLSVGAESQTTQSTGWEVAAAVSWSGPVSFSELTGEPDEGPQRNPALPLYVFGDPDADPKGSEDGDPDVSDVREWEEADPLSHVTADSAAFLLVNSELEKVPPRLARSFGATLRGLAVPHQVEIFEGNLHALALLPSAIDLTVEFLDEFVRDFEPPPPEPSLLPSPVSPEEPGGEQGLNIALVGGAVAAAAVAGGAYALSRVRRARARNAWY